VVKEDIQDIVVGHKKVKFLEFLKELDNPGPVHQEQQNNLLRRKSLLHTVEYPTF
jgi:hypothetical protein